jgi:PAS domain S-box-containing protein
LRLLSKAVNEFVLQESPEDDSILTFALDGHVASASACFLAMFGYSDRDAREGSIDWDALTPPEYWAIDEHCLGKLREGAAPVPFVKEMLHKDGSRIAVRIFVELRPGMPGEAVARVIDLIENHSSNGVTSR